MPVGHFSAFWNQRRYIEARGCVPLALAAILAFAACGKRRTEPRKTETRVVTSSMMAPPSATGETPPMKGQVPQAILDPILKEAAALTSVARDQLVVVRAESVVWNDGSLGCPEPGMMYTQALVNGYRVVINAAGQT